MDRLRAWWAAWWKRNIIDDAPDYVIQDDWERANPGERWDDLTTENLKWKGEQ